MATVFQNLRAKGTLVVLGVATFAGITVTSITSSGSITGTTLSGTTLNINRSTTGSGKQVIHGGDGAYICLRDADNVGWTMISGNNGAITVNGANSTMCP